MKTTKNFQNVLTLNFEEFELLYIIVDQFILDFDLNTSKKKQSLIKLNTSSLAITCVKLKKKSNNVLIDANQKAYRRDFVTFCIIMMLIRLILYEYFIEVILQNN